MVFLTHPDCTGYELPGHPEQPSRITATVSFLEDSVQGVEWRRPEPARDASLLRGHQTGHLERLLHPLDFDPDTPYFQGIGHIARLATGGALGATRLALEGQPAFSIMRPPGHHATRERAMGFCYLSHAGLAALEARANGEERVAIWDFDAHHGNGTEDLVLGREGILFASVHQHPCYPGTGQSHRDNCLNFPVPPMSERKDHLSALRKSWEAILDFQPGLIVVSAGFDAYALDPITEMTLQADDFLTLGTWLYEADIPAAAILEGGYSRDLPYLVGAFLEGWRHG